MSETMVRDLMHDSPVGDTPTPVALQPITALIVDDHIIIREGLRVLLSTMPEIEVVGQADDGSVAIEMVARLEPAVVLMDVKMPGMGGLDATRRIKADYPTTAVIMMTSYEDEAIMVEAVRAGAGGYLIKDSSRELLHHTLLAVANGGLLVKASLLQRALGFGGTGHIAQPRPRVTLTSREETILQLMAEGRTNRAIAEKMGFAEITVKKHVQEIIAKLKASDRTQAAIIALRLGLIE